MKRIYLVVIVVLIFLSGCSENKVTENKSDYKIKIVTTIFPVYDFVRAITGENADITMLVNPGMSIHSYDPSPSEMRNISNSDVFISIGGENETWVDRITDSINPPIKNVIKLIDYVIDEDDKIHDEHIWTSPINAVKMIEIISNKLIVIDKENAEFYGKNADAYITKIMDIDAETHEIVDNAPLKTIVVADRFPLRRFTDEYALSYVAAFDGCSDQSDASVSAINNIVNKVKDENIKYIFYVELSTQNTAKSISEYTGAEMLMFHSCQNVTKSEFDSGETYLSLMTKNLFNLRKALNNQ